MKVSRDDKREIDMPLNRNGRKRRKKEKEERKEKVNLKEKLTEVLELPKDVVMNIPKITMVGNGSMFIENYKGIIEYDNERIRINTGIGVIRLAGEGMTIKEITSEDIIIDGDIRLVEFLK